MTCIVACRDELNTVLAADSMISIPGEISTTMIPKLFQRGPLMLGVSGSMKVAQQLSITNLKTDEIDKYGIHKYLYKRFSTVVDTINKSAQDEGAGILIVYKQQIFELDLNTAINEIVDRDYWSIGSGAWIAMGSLWTTGELNKYTNRYTALDRASMSVEAAAEHITSVGGPINVLRSYDRDATP